MARSTKPRSAAAPRQQGAAPYAKPHACTQCAAAFGHACHLTAHVRTVHEKRRDHACPQCAAAFGAASTLTKHLRTQHPDNSQGEVGWLNLLSDLRSDPPPVHDLL